MRIVGSEPLRQEPWFAAALIATILGAVTAFVVGTWWFVETSGSDAFVRFYEYVLGGLIIGGWVLGTAAGLMVALAASRRGAKAGVVLGCLIAILVNAGLLWVSAMAVTDHLAANLTLQSDEELMELLEIGNLNTKVLAAHKLGERRVAEAIPVLSGLLEDTGQDINLRHNAAIALGEICGSRRPSAAEVDRALRALISALKGPDEYLPSSIIAAMEKIGGDEVVGPLAEFLNDASRPLYGRLDAARTLGRIGGAEGRVALVKARAASNNPELTAGIDRALKDMPHQAPDAEGED